MDFLIQAVSAAGICFLILVAAAIKTLKENKNRNDKE